LPEAGHDFAKIFERVCAIAELRPMRNLLRRFQCKPEFFRCLRLPIVDRFRRGNPVECVIDLRRGKSLRVERQHLGRWQILRIKISLPLCILKSRGSNPELHVKPLAHDSAEQKQASSTIKGLPNVRVAYCIRIHYSGKFSGPSNLVGTEDAYLPQFNKKGEIMKKLLLSIALAMVASLAWGQTTRQPLMNVQQVPQQRTTTATTTTTEGSGTITEFSPGSTIVLKESTGPRHYRFGKTVTYVTRSGKVLNEDTVRTRVKVGVPVRVHYTGTGDNMMVDRVILDQD
jgi:hypothetical protein